nr:hypothetical protein DM860_010389 [Ipomoea batatas]
MTRNLPNYRDMLLRWKATSNCEWTLNVDGSYKSFSNRSGVGGILRNIVGEWQRGIRDLEVQIDATEVLNWITDHTMLRGPARVIVEDIRGWQTRFGKLVLRSTFHEQNVVADRLATIGSS